LSTIPSISTEKIDKGDIIHLVVLLAIAAGTGIYMIATTTLIAKDGVYFIELAQKFSSKPMEVIRNYPFGYPFLIFAVHKLFSLLSGDASSVRDWILAGQSATFLCRLFALVPLYFIGRTIFGGRRSFLALLILTILPYPARFGSDVLREWPYILFLVTGLLVLLFGMRKRHWLIFASVALIACAGYMIRTECIQLVIYAVLWLILELVKAKNAASRRAVLISLCAVIIVSAAVITPYVILRADVLSNKLRLFIDTSTQLRSENLHGVKLTTDGIFLYLATALPVNILLAIKAVIEGIGENLFYFFAVPLVIGFYRRFQNPKKTSDFERLFIPAFIILNSFMLILLYYSSRYVSRRHTLSLIVMTIFYIPIGLQVAAEWLSSRQFTSRLKKNKPEIWFFVLLAIGILISLPNLLNPLRSDKKGYLKASEWLKKNTTPDTIVAVPDKRISFYGRRKGIWYEDDEIPLSAEYVVAIVRNEAEEKTSISKSIELKGLVGYWPGDGTAKDFSGNNNHGTLNGQADFAGGRFGKAFKLNAATGDYVRCRHSSSLNPLKAITVCAWIYPVSASMGTIVSKNGPYSLNLQPDRKIKGAIFAGSPPVWTIAYSKSQLDLNKWQQVALVYDSRDIKLFTNGISEATVSPKSGAMALTRTDMYIGYGEPGINFYFDGLIDEVAIFRWALSEKDIKTLYDFGPVERALAVLKPPAYISRIRGYREMEKAISFPINKKEKAGKIIIYKAL